MTSAGPRPPVAPERFSREETRMEISTNLIEKVLMFCLDGVIGNDRDGEATVAAERFRTRLSGMEFRVPSAETPATVTVSIGISDYRDGCTIDDIARYADMAMYGAKNAGRNRTVTYEQLVNQFVRTTGAA